MTGLQVTDAGALTVETPVKTLTDARPVAYQEREGQRTEVAATFALTEEVAGDQRGYGSPWVSMIAARR